MTTSTKEELDRNTSGRFVRNLALSLSGGALLTLIGAGATAASADDGTAGTAADGQGHAGTGDATAVGNQSGTNTTQTVTVSGNLGTIQVINQQANVVNAGVGVANTGGNIAIGNGSQNDANAEQNSTGGVTGAFNNGDASNSSNGGALINTGNASAVGNQSNTNIVQEAHGDISGSLGSILVINQDANVLNAGVALANSGGNVALGNESNNRSDLLQNAQSEGLAANNGKATTDSNGKATIATGNASATGNKSDTTITQRASGSAGGSMGGLLIIDQDANVANVGAAVSNTGINGAVGNASGSLFGENNADLFQDADAINPANPDIGIASNNGEASNFSDGSATITTGDATSVGNDSTTTINQSATGNVGLGGLSLIDQDANVANVGIAVANSGVNGALGNGSSGFATVGDAQNPQDVSVEGFSDIGVAGNFGKATNASDGTGTIWTGKANAAGNRSQDSITQSAKAEGGSLNLQLHDSNIVNFGVGVANSGINGTAGNLSQNDAQLFQENDLEPGDPDPDEIDTAVAGQFGLASNASDGRAEVVTGDATAVGNQSSTDITQSIDPSGLTVQTQTATVLNVGVGIANSGGNGAVGNASDNDGNGGPGAGANQNIDVDPDDDLVADTLVTANNGEASNSSDGHAHITTGAASATGNESYTRIGQTANAGVPGDGIAINPQTALVVNGGLALANSGGNVAVGNVSQNDAALDQDLQVNGEDITADTLIASNNGTAANASDGTAKITTGDASATGNHSRTELYQSADASVVGSGLIVNPQTGVVLNVGVGLANSGINGAVGNASNNRASLEQSVDINDGVDGDIDTDLLVASNEGEASNASDGTAEIETGAAQAVGNTSDTLFVQQATGLVDGDGVVVNVQNGLVVNGGLAVANSGVNGAVGNISQQDGDFIGAELIQNNAINPNGVNLDAGAVIGSNSGEATNSSDGTATIDTGDAQAQGNVSSTIFTQVATGTIGADGAGIVPNIQNAAVLNLGAGIANSGVNGAVGNASGMVDLDFDLAGDGFVVGPDLALNTALVEQSSAIEPTADDDLDVDSTATSFNQGTASNATDGTGKVRTGGAFASGNVSTSNLTQRIDGSVDGGGLVVAPQTGLIVNVGVGVANSGVNAAVGNLSVSESFTEQDAEFASDNDLEDDESVEILTVGNTGHATNASDGFACTCTGNAWASGNISTSTLTQDMVIGVEDGLSVVPTNGLILNAGFGLANSGVNLSLGNLSDNDAFTSQSVALDPALDDDGLAGPQTFVNGGGASNRSGGTGKVGTGNAKATGNQSTSDLHQAAIVDGAGAFAQIDGFIGNTGTGVANSGINLGLGNDSDNLAVLQQSAEGAGTVANQGEAANASDGFGGVGDPLCEDEVPGSSPETPETPETPDTPGLPGLPKTGGPLEVEAAIGLMLLLAGFGFRRASKKLS